MARGRKTFASRSRVMGTAITKPSHERDVAQLVERMVWDHEAASSRLAIPTNRLVNLSHSVVKLPFPFFLDILGRVNCNHFNAFILGIN